MPRWIWGVAALLAVTAIVVGLWAAGTIELPDGPAAQPSSTRRTVAQATTRPTRRSTSTPRPTTRATSTPRPTARATSVPAPRVSLPAPVSQILSNPQATYHDPFDALQPDEWDYTAGSVRASNGAVVVTGKPDWATYLGRGLRRGEAVLLLFQYEAGAEAAINLTTGEWQRPEFRQWGIDTGNGIKTQGFQGADWFGDQFLLGGMVAQSGDWYYVLLAVDEDGSCVARVWERDHPAEAVVYRQAFDGGWTAQEWSFGISANRGQITVDDYTTLSFDGFAPLSDAEAHFWTGEAQYRDENYEAALAEFNLAIMLDTNDPVAYHRRGNSYANLGQYDKATADWTRSIEVDPDYWIGYNRHYTDLI